MTLISLFISTAVQSFQRKKNILKKGSFFCAVAAKHLINNGHSSEKVMKLFHLLPSILRDRGRISKSKTFPLFVSVRDLDRKKLDFGKATKPLPPCTALLPYVAVARHSAMGWFLRLGACCSAAVN